IGGVRAAVMISAALVLLAIAIQVWMLRSHTKDTANRGNGFSLGLLRRFPPDLKRLLLADILARVAEGMPRELFVLYAVVSAGEVVGFRGLSTFGLSAATFGQLLALQALTSLLIYIPIGWMTSKPGAKKKPFIN